MIYLRFSSLVDSASTQGVTIVVMLSGCPLACGYCNVPDLLSYDNSAAEPLEYFVEYFLSHKPKSIIFTGAEPLLQGNALRELCRVLKQEHFIMQVDTSGYFPESLVYLLPFIDVVQMDVKTKLDPIAYAKLCNAKNPDLLFSGVLRSLTFLQSQGNNVFKQFRTTIIPGVNDSPEVIKDICSNIQFADLYVLQPFSAEGSLVDSAFKQTPSPSYERLLELSHVSEASGVKTLVRTNFFDQ
jgi:pyruvate formate lyase activating enzyme